MKPYYLDNLVEQLRTRCRNLVLGWKGLVVRLFGCRSGLGCLVALLDLHTLTVCIFMTYTLWEPRLNTGILDFQHRLDILSPRDVAAKTKQFCKLHCYVRYQACCYVPPQTLMEVSFMCGRGVRVQTFRLSPKLAQGSLGDLHDSNFTVSQGSPRELGRAWTLDRPSLRIL